MQIPNKGQPIDYSYFTEIVKNINDLQGQKSTQSRISEGPGNDGESPLVEISTPNVVIYTSYIAIANNDPKSTHTQSYTYNFKNAGFLRSPIVMVTAASSTQQSIPEKVILGVSDVNTNSFTIRMNFLEKDIPSVGINIIAIGIPVK